MRGPWFLHNQSLGCCQTNQNYSLSLTNIFSLSKMVQVNIKSCFPIIQENWFQNDLIHFLIEKSHLENLNFTDYVHHKWRAHTSAI